VNGNSDAGGKTTGVLIPSLWLAPLESGGFPVRTTAAHDSDYAAQALGSIFYCWLVGLALCYHGCVLAPWRCLSPQPGEGIHEKRYLRIAAGANLLPLPACLPGFAQAPIAGAFLGTSPVTLTQPPMAAEDVSGFGVDADGDYFYADKVAGTVTKLANDGSRSVVLSGLKQARIAVDYRGDVYVADTGNNRVLALSAGSTVPRVIRGLQRRGVPYGV
jgi:hypothetical protein